jgi:hypothetical protein
MDDPKNVMSNCRKAHRILWDLSSHGDCLHLQKDAIRALLLDGAENRAVRKLVRCNFDNACAYAWKAAQSFRSKSNTAGETLRCFHDEIGTLLDSFATVDHPQSYIEYCAYRALHVGSSQNNRKCEEHCLFRHLRYDYIHECCENSASDNTFMALFFLSLEVRRALESVQMKDNDDFSLVENSGVIVSQFRSIIVDGGIDSAIRISYFRLLSLLKLHRLVFQVLGSASQSGGNAMKHICVAAKILSQCTGPLCFGLIADKSFNKDQLSQMWAVGAECLKQSVSAFEMVHVLSGEERYLDASNYTAGELRRFLSSPSEKPPPDCIENAAKVSNSASVYDFGALLLGRFF